MSFRKIIEKWLDLTDEFYEIVKLILFHIPIRKRPIMNLFTRVKFWDIHDIAFIDTVLLGFPRIPFELIPPCFGKYFNNDVSVCKLCVVEPWCRAYSLAKFVKKEHVEKILRAIAKEYRLEKILDAVRHLPPP